LVKALSDLIVPAGTRNSDAVDLADRRSHICNHSANSATAATALNCPTQAGTSHFAQFLAGAWPFGMLDSAPQVISYVA